MRTALCWPIVALGIVGRTFDSFEDLWCPLVDRTHDNRPCNYRCQFAPSTGTTMALSLTTIQRTHSAQLRTEANCGSATSCPLTSASGVVGSSASPVTRTWVCFELSCRVLPPYLFGTLKSLQGLIKTAKLARSFFFFFSSPF